MLTLGGIYLFKNTIFRAGFITSTILVFLTGCFGPSPQENIYSILENVVTLENQFKEQQDPLLELEKKETALYNEIMGLGMQEFEKVVALSKEAITHVENREKKIEAEYESIMKSKKEFAKVNDEIEKMENEKLAGKAKKLKSTMNDRYDTYEKLYQAYKVSISLDKELYTILQKEELTIEELEAQIKKINDSYNEVMEQNEKFNQLTEEYNSLKTDFYEDAKLNVEESKE